MKKLLILAGLLAGTPAFAQTDARAALALAQAQQAEIASLAKRVAALEANVDPPKAMPATTGVTPATRAATPVVADADGLVYCPALGGRVDAATAKGIAAGTMTVGAAPASAVPTYAAPLYQPGFTFGAGIQFGRVQGCPGGSCPR